MDSKSLMVSVLMTAYNREKYIAEAIKSVLVSTYTNWELIIVDDCSIDQTVSIAKSFAGIDDRIKVYVNEKNIGDYPNRNKAASYAIGKYIKYLDADDMLYFYSLELMVNYMMRYPDAKFGLSSKVDDSTPFPICIAPYAIYFEHYHGYGHFDRSPGSAIIDLDAFKAINGFSGKRYIGDREFWFKIARTYQMVKLPFDLYWNRIHEEQEGQTEGAKKYTSQLVKQIEKEALLHIDCPLSKKEKNQILKKRLIQKRIQILKAIIKYALFRNKG